MTTKRASVSFKPGLKRRSFDLAEQEMHRDNLEEVKPCSSTKTLYICNASSCLQKASMMMRMYGIF